MAINDQKFRQIAASVVVVMSLFVSSIAACACARHDHPEIVKPEPVSCHGQPRQEQEDNTPDRVSTGQGGGHGHHVQAENNSSAPDTGKDAETFNSSCECSVQAPPKVYVKQDNLKIEKQTVTAQSAGTMLLIEDVSTVDPSFGSYKARIYSTPLFFNLTPGRAPPSL